MIKKLLGLITSFFMLMGLSGCSQESDPDVEVTDTSSDIQENIVETDNPFLSPSELYLQYPPFDLIDNSHYLPAFELGMQEQLDEIETLVVQTGEASFENTIIPLERSGQLLNRVAAVFYSLSSAHTNDTINEIEVQIAPRLAAHSDQILLNAELFNRVEAVYQQGSQLQLDGESMRLVEETYRDFIRAGARLSESEKSGLRNINAELAELETAFSQNVLSEVNDLAVVVQNEEELAGLSQAQIQSAAETAETLGLAGQFVIPLLNTSQQPVLPSLDNRDLRQRILEISLSRGSRGGEFDNTEIVSRTAQLRAERAQMLGFDNHADFILSNQTAQTVEAVNERLAQLIPRSVANARTEAEALQSMIVQDGGGFELQAWDWDYYAEKVRSELYDFDEAELKPYLELDSVLQNGVFFAANQVFGLSFDERFDLPVYHEDVRVFEVFNEDGSTLGLFLFDPYARPSKRGGAWMNEYVAQSHLLGAQPIVANHINIPEPIEGEPSLLTFSEVVTIFHEFGHALHGLFSDVTYPSFSGTNVPRDFVEYPSQVNEMWATWPEVLANYAKHYETGEAMPTELLDKVLNAGQFNQGYASTEYLAASLIDQALHQLNPDEVPDAEELMAFEIQVLSDAQANFSAVPPRYRFPYFSHIMSGYSAGYYSYIWSEVLDADSVEWFKENGGMLRNNGDHFRDSLLSRGGSEDAMTLFRNFRGAEPDVNPLLERRGLN